jgi:alpha-ribazole phosphatase
MHITLVRHTRVEVKPHVLYGQSDVALASSWSDDIKEVVLKINATPSKIIYTSPLSRCVKLAEVIKEQLSAKLVKDERIMELHYGEWEQRHLSSLPQDQLVYWKSNFVDQSCPGGETFRQLYNRCLAFINDLKKTSDKDIIVVTHSGVIRALLSHYMKIPLEHIFSFDIAFGSISQILLKEDGKNIVKYVNL